MRAEASRPPPRELASLGPRSESGTARVRSWLSPGVGHRRAASGPPGAEPHADRTPRGCGSARPAGGTPGAADPRGTPAPPQRPAHPAAWQPPPPAERAAPRGHADDPSALRPRRGAGSPVPTAGSRRETRLGPTSAAGAGAAPGPLTAPAPPRPSRSAAAPPAARTRPVAG